MQRCLVILNQPDQADVLLHMAAQVMARVNGSRMDVLAARAPVEDGGGEPEGATGTLQKDWAEGLHATYRTWLVKQYGAPANRLDRLEVNWLDPVITVDGVVSAFARDADILIMGFPGPKDSAHKRQLAQALVFRTGQPVLLVPPFWDRPSGDHVLLAWKETGCCRRAFEAAAAFLPGAREIDVIVPPGQALPPDVLPGFSATRRVLEVHGGGKAAIGQALLDTAHDLHADMLVMGGYEHGMLYSRLMGSVTDYILAHPEIPVLLRH